MELGHGVDIADQARRHLLMRIASRFIQAHMASAIWSSKGLYRIEREDRRQTVPLGCCCWGPLQDESFVAAASSRVFMRRKLVAVVGYAPGISLQ